ncbi:hypothetical protein [Haloarcula halophila]|uniref:hypothetical protein n=1 Tax=Haloarcula TaxID=2237 RepID=UPI0023E409AA|nr:hypothetical protein [Halomicroarcula sp. DFY41]
MAASPPRYSVAAAGRDPLTDKKAGISACGLDSGVLREYRKQDAKDERRGFCGPARFARRTLG